MKRYWKIDWVYHEVDWVYHEVECFYHQVDFFKTSRQKLTDSTLKLNVSILKLIVSTMIVATLKLMVKATGRNGLGFVRGRSAATDKASTTGFCIADDDLEGCTHLEPFCETANVNV